MQSERFPAGSIGSAGEPEVNLAVAPVPGEFDHPVAFAPLNGVLGDTVHRESVIRQERELVLTPVLKA